MPSEFTTIIEPFRIKSVEPIRFTTRAHREAALREAGHCALRAAIARAAASLST